jgi:divalent metal cation (Fe/Co/Zn/Cd) transporter
VHYGPENLLVAAKVEFDRSLDLPQLAAAIDQVEDAMRASVDITQTIYIEPDIRRQMTS